MPACRSPEMQHFDFFLFSILFSSSVARQYFDVGALFVVFYACFYLLDLSKHENTCVS
jgi:hypothetical protein